IHITILHGDVMKITYIITLRIDSTLSISHEVVSKLMPETRLEIFSVRRVTSHFAPFEEALPCASKTQRVSYCCWKRTNLLGKLIPMRRQFTIQLTDDVQITYVTLSRSYVTPSRSHATY